MKNEKFQSFDGTTIQCYIWNDVKKPKGVVYISHGMAEHARRYDDFASYLNQNGYIVYADDHRAHGITSAKASAKGVKGYQKGDIFEDTLKDQFAITASLKERFGLPVIFFGHSYGSMLGQRFIETENDTVGTILSGSARVAGGLLGFGLAVVNMQYAFLGGEKKAKLIDKLNFGSYQTQFKKEKRPFAWLSRDEEQCRKYYLDEMCGYPMSIAFYKYFFKGLKKAYTRKNLAKIDVKKPIYLFSGSLDPVGGKGKFVQDLHKMYVGCGVEKVEIKLYEGARHEILNETNRAEVYADILVAMNEIIG